MGISSREKEVTASCQGPRLSDKLCKLYSSRVKLRHAREWGWRKNRCLFALRSHIHMRCDAYISDNCLGKPKAHSCWFRAFSRFVKSYDSQTGVHFLPY